MDKKANIALIMQMIEAAEKSLATSKQLLREYIGETSSHEHKPGVFNDKLKSLMMDDAGKVIEGIFDGQNMMGPDGKQYPVPANYASKSKLVEGDVLKLSISEDGSFVYKQIGPVDRKKMIGILSKDDKGDFIVLADGKIFKVLLASLTYYKAEPGDEVTIVIPTEVESNWAAVDNVIKAAPNMTTASTTDQSSINAMPSTNNHSFGVMPKMQNSDTDIEFTPDQS